MFFSEQRLHFFRPLVGKYREVVVECVRLLYQRLYTDLTGYGQQHGRDFVVDVFVEAIARAPLLDDEEVALEGRFKDARALAGFILNNLLDAGWLEKQLDEATLQSHYSFTRMGRYFAQPFVDSGKSDYRSRNRNTRNTRNSLKAFYDQGDVYDLLDALEYSERIISDFADTIAELEERRLQLVREVESRQLIEQAADQFFDFIDTVFKPDLEVRLSADSVEKYRDQIAKTVREIRKCSKRIKEGEYVGLMWKAAKEIQLRKLLPGRVVEGQSLLETMLHTIEERMKSASEIMLPALRRALNNFTARADIIIRQLSYLHRQADQPLLEACNQLRAMGQPEQEQALMRMGQALAGVRAGWLASEQFVLRHRRRRRPVQSGVGAAPSLDREAQKAQFISRVLDQAFHVSSQQVRDYVSDKLINQGRVYSKHLAVQDARQLLALAHVVSLAGEKLDNGFEIRIHPARTDNTGVQVFESNDFGDGYFHARENFELELVDRQQNP